MDNLLNVPALEGILAPQGLLAPHIIVPDDGAGSEEDLVQSVVDFVNIVQERARLSPGEYPEEASWSYCADYYLAQVNNGGHGQYAHNSRMMPRTLRDCRLGLQAMGAHEYLAIFETFLTIMAKQDDRARAIAEGGGFGDIDPEIQEMDSRFFALGDMLQKNGAWLRTLPHLKIIPRAEIEAAFDAIAATNPLREVRMQAAAEAKRKYEHEDPTYAAAHACAAYEGGEFQHLTAGTPIGDVGILWGAVTSKGFRWLKVIHGNHAEWRDDKQGLKAIHYYATGSKYSAPVGSGDVRGALMAHSRGRGATVEELGAFYLGALTRASGAIAPEHQSAFAIAVAASIAKNLQVLPRGVWRGFDRSEEHATLRLTLAYALWDQTIAVVQRSHGTALNNDYTTGALMAAGGALAATGIAALRLPLGRDIVALKAASQGEYEREQHNVMEQIREIADWFRLSVSQMASESQRTSVSNNLFLRPSAYRFARNWVLRSANPPTEALAHRMRFYDDEYPSRPLKAKELVRVARRTLDSFMVDPDNHNLLQAAQAFGRAYPLSGAHANWASLLRVGTPAQVNAPSKAALVAVTVAFDPNKGVPEASAAVEYDAKGRRVTIGQKK